MNNKTPLEIAIQKIDELHAMMEKHISDPHAISKIEQAVVMDKLQFVYDVYFKLSINVLPTEEDKTIDLNETENLRPKAESSIDDFHEAADESVITPIEEDTLVPKPENEIDLFINDKDIVENQELETIELAEEKASEKDKEAQISEDITKKDIIVSSDEKIDLFSTSFDINAKTVAQEISDKGLEENVAEKLEKNKISNIKEAIGINEKFYFINELFDGVMKEYSEAIEKLNLFTTSNERLAYLSQIKEERSWTDDSEAYIQLKEIAERKFSTDL